MKKAIQSVLRSVGLYQRVKTSIAYDLYWKVFDRELIDHRNDEVAFFRDLLAPFRQGDLIFDVGANLGRKTDVFLRLGARVLSVDPDLSNQEILRQRFLSWRLRRKPVTIIGKAISDRSGTETFWVDAPGSAKNTLNTKWVDTLRTDSDRFGERLEFRNKREVETVTLDELIAQHGKPAYVKIDVEGHEFAVLKGLNQAVPMLSFEVNLPEFKSEAVQCIDRLAALDPGGQFNQSVDCRKAFAAGSWRTRGAFLETLDACEQPCIEVFWKSAWQ